MASAKDENRGKQYIRIMQINAGRAAKTNAEIRFHADQDNVKIAAIQELYTVRGKISSYAGQARVITGTKSGETPWAAIVIFDSTLTVMKLVQHSDSHTVCIQVDDRGFSFYIINMYCQFSTPMEPYLQKIRKIKQNLTGQKIIICADANAKSPMWHSQTLDEEGVKVEDLIQELGLLVINELHNLSTFSTPQAESNIDVTLTTNQAANYVSNWWVKEDWISSDHRAITFDLTPAKLHEMDMNEKSTIKFQMKKANWDRFNARLPQKLASRGLEACQSRMEVIHMAKTIRRTLLETCKEAIPLKRTGKVATKW